MSKTKALNRCNVKQVSSSRQFTCPICGGFLMELYSARIIPLNDSTCERKLVSCELFFLPWNLLMDLDSHLIVLSLNYPFFWQLQVPIATGSRLLKHASTYSVIWVVRKTTPHGQLGVLVILNVRRYTFTQTKVTTAALRSLLPLLFTCPISSIHDPLLPDTVE